MKLTSIINAIRDFFFKPVPVQSVAVVRVIFGLLLLANWYMTWTHLNVFWGVDGLVSLNTSIAYGSSWRFSFFDWLPNDPRVPVLIALVNLVAALGVTFGLLTRTSILFAFLTVMSFHNRNVFILNSSDLVLRNLLFFMLFTPSGEAYSLDRLIKKMRGVAPAIPLERAPWGLRLMQIQFCMIYIATVMFKMKGSYWADGTAIYIATRLDEFVRMPLPLLNNLFIIKMLTWGTLVVEFALGTLVWIKELRYWVLLAGIGLHMGIEVVMNIPMFEWVMIAAMLLMVDPYDVVKIEAWLKNRIKNRRADSGVAVLTAANAE
ncbi:MAG TPA: HTTM domain-containing protein [Bdellovibrio sp.]|uniref:HTTM domain-containing protein n=1 Tax=Bdellovibrio sp. TaxID=28201 RepID=UPI002F0C072C